MKRFLFKLSLTDGSLEIIDKDPFCNMVGGWILANSYRSRHEAQMGVAIYRARYEVRINIEHIIKYHMIEVEAEE